MNNLFPADELPFACTAFIRSKLDQYLPDINAKLQQKLHTLTDIPQFATASRIGELPVTGTAYMTVNLASARTGGTPISMRTVGGTNHYAVSYMFFITALIPLAGDNTALNYEVMLQTAAGVTTAWLTDSSQALMPVVWLADIPDIGAMVIDATPGDLVTIFPMTQADGKTVQRGFKIPYTLRFDVAGGYAMATVPKTNVNPIA